MGEKIEEQLENRKRIAGESLRSQLPAWLVAHMSSNHLLWSVGFSAQVEHIM